jgi:hypothetical protein
VPVKRRQQQQRQPAEKADSNHTPDNMLKGRACQPGAEIQLIQRSTEHQRKVQIVMESAEGCVGIIGLRLSDWVNLSHRCSYAQPGKRLFINKEERKMAH